MSTGDPGAPGASVTSTSLIGAQTIAYNAGAIERDSGGVEEVFVDYFARSIGDGFGYSDVFSRCAFTMPRDGALTRLDVFAAGVAIVGTVALHVDVWTAAPAAQAPFYTVQLQPGDNYYTVSAAPAIALAAGTRVALALRFVFLGEQQSSSGRVISLSASIRL